MYEDTAEGNIYSNEYGDFNADVVTIALERNGFIVKRINWSNLKNLETLETGIYLICTGYHWFALRKFFDAGPLWNPTLIEPEILGNIHSKISS